MVELEKYQGDLGAFRAQRFLQESVRRGWLGVDLSWIGEAGESGDDAGEGVAGEAKTTA